MNWFKISAAGFLPHAYQQIFNRTSGLYHAAFSNTGEVTNRGLRFSSHWKILHYYSRHNEVKTAFLFFLQEETGILTLVFTACSKVAPYSSGHH